MDIDDRCVAVAVTQEARLWYKKKEWTTNTLTRNDRMTTWAIAYWQKQSESFSDTDARWLALLGLVCVSLCSGLCELNEFMMRLLGCSHEERSKAKRKSLNMKGKKCVCVVYEERNMREIDAYGQRKTGKV